MASALASALPLAIAMLAGLAHQGGVAAVECAHGGDEAHGDGAVVVKGRVSAP